MEHPFLWVGILEIVAFFGLLILGLQIAVAMIVVGGIGLYVMVGMKGMASLLTLTAFYRICDLGLLIIPLFILVGLVAAMGGISSDAYECLRTLLGKFKAGLGIATTGACTLFGAVCGSSLVTATVFAKVSVPDMVKYGYDKRLAYSLTTCSGTIGVFIPPSILIIVYSILTQESPGQLLIAGATPGILMFFAFSILTVILIRLKPSLVADTGQFTEVTWQKQIASLRLLWPIAIVTLVLFGGIYSGFFSVMESASYAVLVVCILSFGIRRSFKGIGEALAETASITGMIFLIYIGSMVLGRSLVLAGITDMLLDFILGLHLSSLGLVIGVCLLYLVLGTFMDTWSILAVTIPLIYPVVRTMGIDFVWYGMCACLSVELGCLTPPVGVTVYAVKGVAGEDIGLEELFVGVVPYFLAGLVVLVLIIAFPILSTYLASKMFL